MKHGEQKPRPWENSKREEKDWTDKRVCGRFEVDGDGQAQHSKREGRTIDRKKSSRGTETRLWQRQGKTEAKMRGALPLMNPSGCRIFQIYTGPVEETGTVHHILASAS